MRMIVLGLLLVSACLEVKLSRPRSARLTETLASARKIYANPYHPEDDNVAVLQDFTSDEDGDNLHSIKYEQLSDTEKKIIKIKPLKVNGRYYTIGKKTERPKSEELWKNLNFSE